jgi:hypothetical protein
MGCKMSAELSQPRIVKRILPPEEWDSALMSNGKSLREIFHEQGGEFPDPRFGEMHIIEIDNRIAAFGVLQLVPHLDPVMVDESFQGSPIGLMLKIVHSVEDRLRESEGRGYFIFANNEVVAGMAERLDFKRQSHITLFKEIGG